MTNKFLLTEFNRASKNLGATDDEIPRFTMEVHELGLLFFSDGFPMDGMKNFEDLAKVFFPRTKDMIMAPCVAQAFGATFAMCPEINAEEWEEIARKRWERVSGGNEFMAWLNGPDTGVSSKKIVSYLTGYGSKGNGRQDECNPWDPADLNRCVKVLDRFPALRDNFSKMAEVGPVWKALVENWEDLESTLKREIADRTLEGSAPETYRKMNTIIDEAQKGKKSNVMRTVIRGGKK